MSGQAPVNPLELSDEEFLKLGVPPSADAGRSSTSDNSDTTNDGGEQEQNAGSQDGDEGNGTGGGDDDGAGNSGDDGASTTTADDGAQSGDEPTGEESGEGAKLPKDSSQGQPAGGKSIQGAAPESKDSGKPALEDGSQAEASSTGSKTNAPATPVNYEEFFKRVTAPLKANGKTIEIRTPEEAITLMQQGANYTRKMQALAPHRKMLLMLENNGLLDEGKLSFLIDIEKKNPEAIRKLLKDAQIDPRDIDLEDPTAKPYLEGNHRVSDQEANFKHILEELRSTPEGFETLQIVNSQWDQASKEELYKHPDVLPLIQQQRANGIYDRITTELERQRALGQVPAHIPFLHAYKIIGDQLAQAGHFNDLMASETTSPPPQQQQQVARGPVITRTEKPKASVTNGDKVSAATSTRSNPREAKTTVNPLALSDDDFMKQVAAMQGRL